MWAYEILKGNHKELDQLVDVFILVKLCVFFTTDSCLLKMMALVVLS